MTVVVDASVVVAALVDTGPNGTWAEHLVASEHLVAPNLLHAEVANILRRAERRKDLSRELAALAYHDLLDLPVQTFPYEPLGERIWELRRNLTAYDAWYAALAERLGMPLATLDQRLSRSPGPTCEFLLPT